MKDNLLLKITSFTFICLLILLSPLLIYSNVSLSFYQLIQYNETKLIFYVILGIFLLILILFSLSLKFKNSSSFLFFCSLIFFIFGILFFVFPLFNPAIKFRVDRGAILTGISLILLSLYFISDVFDNSPFSIKDMVEIGLFVGFALILEFPIFKIKIGASGGSISFSMIPLIYLSLRKNFIMSFIGNGIIFGLLSCLMDGYGFVTYPFDYLLGYGCLSFISLFRHLIFPKGNYKVKAKGIIFLILSFSIAMVGRLFASTLSGILIYKLAFVPSIIYQLTYIGPSFAICLVVFLLLYKPLLLINKKHPVV